MAELVLLPAADEIESGACLLYDGAGRYWRHANRGRGNPSADRKGARHRGRYPPPQPGDQCRDVRDLQGLLLNGEGDAEDNIVGGPKHSNLANNAFPSHEFDFMLSNPLYVKSWKSDLERTGGKSDMKDPRFMIVHGTTRAK